jgi:hypothetical protein
MNFLSLLTKLQNIGGILLYIKEQLCSKDVRQRIEIPGDLKEVEVKG